MACTRVTSLTWHLSTDDTVVAGVTHFGIKYAFVDEPGCCHRSSRPTFGRRLKGTKRRGVAIVVLKLANYTPQNERRTSNWSEDRTYLVEKKEQLTTNSYVLWNCHSLLCLNCFKTIIRGYYGARCSLYWTTTCEFRVVVTHFFATETGKYRVTSCQNATTLICLVCIFFNICN